MEITYNGHACFSIRSGSYTILIDPYASGTVPGYADLQESANEVLCTHEHSDHNAREAIALVPGGDPSPFTVSDVHTWHDHDQGAKRGPNTIYCLEAEGERIVHLGDLGCALTEDQVRLLTGASILLIPVGGHYTIDADEAFKTVQALSPRLVIPMHYSGSGFGYDVISPVTPFLRHFSSVKMLETASLSLPVSFSEPVAVLHAKYRTV